MIAKALFVAGISAAVLACCCIAQQQQQQCKSSFVQTYVERRKNASRAAISAIKGVVGNVNGGDPADERGLYDSVTETYNLEQSNDSFASFSNALNQISEAHFQACYGPEETRPTLDDVSTLVDQLLQELSMTNGGQFHQTLLDAIRSTFGKLTCLQEMAPDQPTSSSNQTAGCDKTLSSYRNCLSDNQFECLLGVCPEVVNNPSQNNRWHRCVGFVVDDTGSMSEEIVAVRQNIIQFINEQQNSNLLPDCYVLISFNDYNLPNPSQNVGTLRVYDSRIAANSETPTITRVNGGTVYGINQLKADVGALTANGGHDCPEYGMTGTLEAISGINSVMFPPNGRQLHHIILLTDATAKDDNLYQQVINNAQAANITVHFFYSGSGCSGGGYQNYETVRTATGGVAVTSFQDFSVFGTFIQQFTQQVIAGSSRRKRQSGAVGIFSAHAACHSVSMSIFNPSVAVLVRTSSTGAPVTITKPDGTSQTLSIGTVLGLSENINPQPGTWTFCASTGTIQIAVNAPVVLEIDVQFTKRTPTGVIVPTADKPFACSTGTIFVRTPQLPLISLNHTTYLDLVDEDNNVVESIELSDCSGVLSGTGNFPGFPVFYQLRGTTSQANPFAYVIPNSQNQFKGPNFSLRLAYFDVIPVNLGEASFFTMSLLYNNSEGVPLEPGLEFVKHASIALAPPSTTTILPSEAQDVIVEFRAGNDTLMIGDQVSLMITVSDNCTEETTVFTHTMIVYRPIPFVVGNYTSRKLILTQWNPPSDVDVQSYRLTLDYTNGTVSHVPLMLNSLRHITEELSPYQRVLISCAGLDNDSNIVAFTSPRQYRSSEAIPGNVSVVTSSALSNSSARISWNPPTDANGVLLSYYIRIEDHNGRKITEDQTITDVYDRQYEVSELDPYVRYRAVLKAANSAGIGQESGYEFYTKEGAPTGTARNIMIRGLNKTAAEITWDPPPVDQRRGFIKDYRVVVEYFEDGKTKNKTYTVPGRSVIVTDVPELADLNVTVSGSTVAGSGPKITHEGVLELVPSHPRNVSGTSQSLTAIALTWLPPEEPNGVILTYLVEYHNNKTFDGRWLVLNKFEEDEMPNAIITGLPSFDRFIFTVTASTSAGYGDQSPEAIVDSNPYSAGIVSVIVIILLIVIVTVGTGCIIGGVWIHRRMRKNKDREEEEDENELIDGKIRKKKDRYSFQELLQDWKEREIETMEKS